MQDSERFVEVNFRLLLATVTLNHVAQIDCELGLYQRKVTRCALRLAQGFSHANRKRKKNEFGNQ